MSNWLQRVEQEYEELNARKVRLANFFLGPEFAGLSERSKALLRKQHACMDQLVQILRERIMLGDA